MSVGYVPTNLTDSNGSVPGIPQGGRLKRLG